jgi:glycine/serine hydroxymethyltransferase
MEQVADFIGEVLEAGGSEEAINRIRPRVVDLCRRFPVYGP